MAGDGHIRRSAHGRLSPVGALFVDRLAQLDEVSGTVFEQEITADLPANTQFLSPRLFMNNGATAAAVAYDCSGVYVETDF